MNKLNSVLDLIKYKYPFYQFQTYIVLNSPLIKVFEEFPYNGNEDFPFFKQCINIKIVF